MTVKLDLKTYNKVFWKMQLDLNAALGCQRLEHISTKISANIFKENSVQTSVVM